MTSPDVLPWAEYRERGFLALPCPLWREGVVHGTTPI